MMTNELITAIEAMDPATLEAIGLGFGALITIGILFALVRYLMISIGYSKMHRKAGEAGWKAFVPVYNTYNNYKIAWAGKFFYIYAALYILFSAVSNGTHWAVQLAAAVSGVALIVVDMKRNIKMAKAFGKGAGTGVALFFFPGITSLVLGLGKAEMIENN